MERVSTDVRAVWFRARGVRCVQHLALLQTRAHVGHCCKPIKARQKMLDSVDLTCSRIYLFLFICSLKCVLSGSPRLALLSAEPGD